MIGALVLILSCELAGEALKRLWGLPAPGAVIGMVLLAAGLILRKGERRSGSGAALEPPSELDKLAETLLANMGLLFVPAGVGVVAEGAILRREWLPILAGVLGSTLIGLIVTGLAMHWTLPEASARDEAAPGALR